MTKKVLSKSSSTNPHIRAYIKAVQKGLKAQHIIPTKSKWVVKRIHTDTDMKTFSSQQDALAYAQKTARSERADIFIHGLNGRIKERLSFYSSKT